MNKDELLELVLRATQPSSRLQHLDTQREYGAICFTWQGRRYRVTTGLQVTEQIDAAWSETADASAFVARLRSAPARYDAPSYKARRRIGARS